MKSIEPLALEVTKAKKVLYFSWWNNGLHYLFEKITQFSLYILSRKLKLFLRMISQLYIWLNNRKMTSFFNLFYHSAPLLCPLKTSENLCWSIFLIKFQVWRPATLSKRDQHRFSDIFRRYRNRTWGWNGSKKPGKGGKRGQNGFKKFLPRPFERNRYRQNYSYSGQF